MQALKIIEEWQDKGFVLNLRQLYYQFVARGHIENSVKSYKKLGVIVSDARLAGVMDWDSIEDLTRNLRSVPHWRNPASIISTAANGYRIDKWADQEYRVEVWVEKEALLGVVQGVCEPLDVDHFACRGTSPSRSSGPLVSGTSGITAWVKRSCCFTWEIMTHLA